MKHFFKQFFNNRASDHTKNVMASEIDNNSVLDKNKENSHNNSNLSNYIDYYKTLDKPGFAVLVTGDWGVGKTHQVKMSIPESERYYVSLYGISSAEEIDKAVLAATLSGIANNDKLKKSVDILETLGEKYLSKSIMSNIISFIFKSIINPDRILIFDDLERSILWNTDRSEILLGTINYYVEHRGFRVIVICHDKKIQKKISDSKEKVFGQTINIRPQSREVLTYYIDRLDEGGAKDYINSKNDMIFSIWELSCCASLRVMKHVINDIVRLYDSIEDIYKNNNDYISFIISTHMIISIEIRSGVLDHSLLFNRMNKYINEQFSDKDNTDKPMHELVNKYTGFSVIDDYLSDEIVREILVDGYLDRKKVNDFLLHSEYYSDTPLAPWKIVIDFDKREDDILNEAIENMEKQFINREIVSRGEFTHIAALRLILVQKGHYKISLNQEVNNCKQYIDDIFDQKKLPPRSIKDTNHFFDDSYDGHGYWSPPETKPQLDEIVSYWKKMEEKSLNNIKPKYAKEILDILVNNPDDFYKTISFVNGYHSDYLRLPILHYINPKEFVSAWLGNKRIYWRMISSAINNRYDMNYLNEYLQEERDWLKKIAREFDRIMKSENGLHKYRLLRIRPKIFDAVLPPTRPKKTTQ